MKIDKKISILLCTIVLVMTSCQRKDLYYPVTSKLQVNIHWKEDIAEKPVYNQIVLYPTNGGKSQIYYLDSDSEIISVVPGEYNVILYNWRTNAAAQTVQFRNEERYLGMTAFTGLLMNKSGYFDQYEIYLSPDMLFSWSTEDYIPQRVIALKGNEENITVLDTYPVEVSHNYNFHVEVIGLQYVTAVSAVAVGFTPTLTMYDKSASEKDAGHKLNIKTTENGFDCTFSAFNHYQPNNQRLHFVIKLPDGTYREYFRDLNKELDENGKITYVEKIVIDYDGPLPPPPTGGGFDPPEIGDWVDNEEDVVFPESIKK